MRISSHTLRRGRKRVAVVLDGLGAGGAPRAAVQQAACLDPAEWQVEIASLERSASPRGETRLPAHVPVRRPGGRGLARWLREFAPDLVHAHLVHATLACRLAAPFAGDPALVATCHELSDWRELRHRPLRLLARAALHHCGAVLAASEAVRAEIAAHDAGLAARTRVLRNGTDLSAFTAVRGMRAAAREVLGYRPGTFVLGTVARLDPRKGLDLLLDAASRALPRVPGLELLVVGDGAERERLMARAGQLGLLARVRFVGEQSDVRPYLAAFDLFAAPSRSEGSGLALVEALAAGVPVAGAPIGGIPEKLAGGAAGWLVPLSLEAWSEAIVRASRAPAELERLSAAGLARAQEYSLERMRGELVECYRSVLEEAGSVAQDAAA
jgi:glycosyltransferase involved in cell wall biosynthesis